MPASIFLSIVLSDPDEGIRRLTTTLATRTLHSLYIDPVHCGTVHTFGERLATSLAQSLTPNQGLQPTAEEESALRHLRGSYAFRARADPRVSLHASESLEGWTIICEEDSLFALSSGPRHVYVKPIPESWDEALLYVRPQVEEAVIWPHSEETVGPLETALGISRLRSL